MMRPYRQLPRLVAVLLAALACTANAAEPLAISNPEALNAVLDDHVRNGYAPFLYARLEGQDGTLLYERSAVNADLLPGWAERINGGTWMRIWSMSKIVTISVVLDLMEEGVLSLDDPVAKHIPEFKAMQVAVTADGRNLSEAEGAEDACPFKTIPATTEMTVAHLVNHQAGFYYATNNLPCLDEPLRAKNLPVAKDSKAFIGHLASLPLIQQPGAKYHYGTNTTVLGMVAERAAGKSLKQLVEERLTGPLGIQGLQYGLPEGAELLPRMSGKEASGWRLAHPGELDIFGPDVPDYDPAHALYLGGEGMLATADGYADFLRMLLNRGALNGQRFLEEATVEAIRAPHTLTDSPEGYNGYNLWVSGEAMRVRQTGEAGLWIGGGYEGTHFWVDPKRAFVAVIMTQLFWPPKGAPSPQDAFRGALYKQLWAAED